jgi:hypothetical protein
MRSSLLIAATFPLVMFACEEDLPVSLAPTPSLDGSVLDAAHPVIEASTPDASVPDTFTPPAPVTVRVTTRSGPKAGVRVVFHDGSGAVLETKLTGNDGTAISAGAIPAMASVLLGDTATKHIVTWTDIESGDVLQARDYEAADQLGAYLITPPSASDGALSYRYTAGACSTAKGDSQPATLPISPDCVGAQGAVLAQASTGSGSSVYGFKKGNALPVDGGTVNVATSAWAAPSSVDVTVANLPPDTFVQKEFLQIADGVGFLTLPSTENTFPAATGFADGYQATAHWEAGSSFQVISKRVAPTASITLDASQALPLITSSAVAEGNSLRPVFSWTSTSTSSADGGVVHVDYRGTADATYRWSFVVKPGSLSVTAPALPAEAAAFMPEIVDGGSSPYSPPEVYFFESDLLPNYAALRKMPALLERYGQRPISELLPPLPQIGNARVTFYIVFSA